MELIAQNISKSFNSIPLFSNLNFSVTSSNPLAILGKNGSGKSTLLKILAGIITPDNGLVKIHEKNIEVAKDEAFKNLSITAPYSGIIENFTLNEALHFHFKFNDYLSGFNNENIIESLGMKTFESVEIKKFSSGMKQKLKIALAVFSSKKILFFDEPCISLDSHSQNWYNQIIEKFTQNRLLIICSNNNKQEFSNCEQIIELNQVNF